jgi:hypothetical protein
VSFSFLYDHFLDAAAVIEATSTCQLQNRAAGEPILLSSLRGIMLERDHCGIRSNETSCLLP